MTTRGKDSSIENSAKEAKSTSRVAQKQTISPGERWLLISEKAYHRAQKRGFVGGDPGDDWLEAEQEVDAKYATEFQGVLPQTDVEELTKQLKCVFGGYGLGHLTHDAILQKHRNGLAILSEQQRKVIDSTSKLATQQTTLFQDAVSEATETLQSFGQCKVSTDGFAKQAEMSARAIENVLSYFKALTESAAKSSPSDNKGNSDK